MGGIDSKMRLDDLVCLDFYFFNQFEEEKGELILESLSLSQIIGSVNGRINSSGIDCELKISNISTNSRDELLDSLFIPIVGENHDGHDYIESAFENGALCVLSEKIIEIEKPVIFVDDTKKALLDLAEYYLSRFDIPVVAVTGSAGKTTTKDLIHSVLSVKLKTLKTEGNYNNEIGLPLTVFRLDSSHEAAILEMGMSGFGEIHRLSKVARPNVAVLTNVGTAHLEQLGSRENIFKAKCEIFDYLKPNGVIVANGDDYMLAKIKEIRGDAVFYGINKIYDFYASEIEKHGLFGTSFKINDCSETRVNLPGKHMIYNALAAAAVGEALGLSSDEIAQGIAEFKPSSANRMEIVTAKSGLTIINDCYNANPDAMKAAIDVLLEADGKTACVLGDMLELGEHSAKLHREVGHYAAEKGVDLIICAGENAENIFMGAEEVRSDCVYWFENKQVLSDRLVELLAGVDAVLVKASRGMKFEEIVSGVLTETM